MKTTLDPDQDAQSASCQQATVETQHRRDSATKRQGWRYIQFKKLTPDEGLLLIVIATLSFLAIATAVVLRILR